MKPLENAPSSWIRDLSGVLFDLDDTLLDRGRLLPSALDALVRLQAAGLELYAVTGRPASWGGVLTHQWPIEGAITENGAIGFERRGGRVMCLDPLEPPERAQRRELLMRAVATLQAHFGELEPTDDVAGRISDFTFDIGEHARLEPTLVSRVQTAAQALGAATTRSSVHIHVSFDRADKASGVVRLIHGRTGLDPVRILSRYAFIGDSENDGACFASFRLTVGVGNLSGRPTLLPAFCVRKERALGFIEAAETLLARRRDLG